MADLELGNAVVEYQDSVDNDERVASLKKVASQVKHKALAETTAISIIGLVTDALLYGGEMREAGLSLLAYLVRRIHSQGQLSSSKVAAALNTIPNWPDILTALRKRGVPTDVRNELQMALERPPSSGSSHGRALAPERKQAFSASRPTSSGSGPGKSGGTAATRPAATRPAATDNGLEAIHVSSSTNLDQICRDMLPDFEGKESEGNWPKRDKNILKLRQITKGNAVTDFTTSYIANWKVLLDGIIKCATSLRTTFSTNGCLLIQEAADAVGHGLDLYSGRLLEISVKMCGDTKPIAAQNGNNCVLALIRNVSWHRQVMSYIAEACQDKNVRPREFSYGWIQAALEVHGSRKSVLEQGHGVDTLDKCFRRGIADPNPKVRETAKKAFWDFHAVFPARADALMTSLEERVQKSIKILNPEGGAGTTAAASGSAPGRGVAAAKAKAVISRPSIKDMMAAKRKEKATERPQSALATFPSVDRTAMAAKKPTAPAQRGPLADSQPVGGGGGGLSSAPVRPGRKVISRAVSRPELKASAEASDRPKTPFGADRPRRPVSRAEEKRGDGPRRPVASAAKAPLTATRPMAAVRKPQAPSSLPASPEKALASPVGRPKSITEDSPIAIRSRELGDRSRFGSPASPEKRFRTTMESPLHAHVSSRLSTPARVYEDPRTSPSPSPQSVKARTPILAPRDISNRLDHDATPTIEPSANKFTASGEVSMLSGEGMSPVKMPLMELSTNEVNTPSSAGKTDPRYAKLIDSGIVHMKSGKLDPHGYRKLHAVVLDQIETLSAEKYEELLTTVIQAAPAGQENTKAGSGASEVSPMVSSERILVQRLHLLSALGKSAHIQTHMSQVLRAFIHIVRHEALHDGHTYWVAEGQLREFAEKTSVQPNVAARGVLAAPQDVLNSTVLRCVRYLVDNTAFDRDDGELVSIVADLAGQAIALDKDVDARIQGHELAKALGTDTIKRFLGEEGGGVAFMLYQSMKGDA